MGKIKIVPFRKARRGFVVGKWVYAPAYQQDRDAMRWLASRGFVLLGWGQANMSHRTDLPPNQRGEVTLIPGTENTRGLGVYFAPPSAEYRGGAADSANSHEYFVVDRQVEAAGAEISRNSSSNFHVPSGLRLHVVATREKDGRQQHLCLVTEVLAGPVVSEARRHVFQREAVLTKRALREAEQAMRPSQCLGWQYRLLGILLGVVCWVVAAYKKLRKAPSHTKWYGLGRFLLAIGGEYRIPADVASEWNSGLVREKDKAGLAFIRPDAKGQLFWLVGGMTVDMVDGRVTGKDVYDFHIQSGQNTILGDGEWCWAWSGGSDDPTQIPAEVELVASGYKLDLYQLVSAIWPKLRERYIRSRDGRIEFSNDLWNAVGGKPFTSVLEVVA